MEYIGNILYDESLLEEDGKLILFGAGVYGQRVLHYLERNGVKNHVVCFCDSNVELQGREVEGIPIYSVGDACLQFQDADFLVAGTYSKEMYQILREKGIRKIHVLFL